MIAGHRVLDDQILGMIIVEGIAFEQIVMGNVPFEGVDKHALSICVHPLDDRRVQVSVVAVDDIDHRFSPCVAGANWVGSGSIASPLKGGGWAGYFRTSLSAICPSKIARMTS